MAWGKARQDHMTLQTFIGPDLIIRIEFYGEGRCDAHAMAVLRQNLDILEKALDRGPVEEPEQEQPQ